MKAPLALVFAIALALVGPAAAQTWPTKPVSIVVGYPAGSGIETVARFLAESLRERTGQPFIIENKPGRFANIGAQFVAHAAPDGYTMLFTPNSTHAANIHLFKSIGFDPVKDFTPITTIATLGFVLLVNPAVVPVSSVKELTEYIRARPGKLAFGSGAAMGRVSAELYLSMSGLKQVIYVPYKGVPPALNDLMGGQIHFMFADATLGIPQARAGKVRALAVTNAKRLSAAPDIPTMSEAGLPGYELGSWFGVFFPAHAPREIVLKLAELCNASMATDKAREFLRNLGADPFPGSPESLAKLVETDMAKWGRIIKAAGIEPE